MSVHVDILRLACLHLVFFLGQDSKKISFGQKYKLMNNVNGEFQFDYAKIKTSLHKCVHQKSNFLLWNSKSSFSCHN